MNRILLGDNLRWLRSDFMRAFYQRVKMIYIDPPYNTGITRSYSDRFQSNTWETEIKERISTCSNFLSESGVFFVSIDDDEYARLKTICDDVFGKKNFIGTFITRQSQRSNSRLINITHEYILAYAKRKDMVQSFSIPRVKIPEQNRIITFLSNEIKEEFFLKGKKAAIRKLNDEIKRICLEMNITWLKNYNSVDDNGRIFSTKDLSVPGIPHEVRIPEIDLYLPPLKTRAWSSNEKFLTLYQRQRLIYKGMRPYEIHYLEESTDSAASVLNFYSRQGTNDLNKLGLRDLFDTPKPVELIKFLIRLVVQDNDIVMDFYAGSGTTAQAVYEVNQEDNRKLSYLLIQKKEIINRTSKSYDVCMRMGISPYISNVLLFRIGTWLKKNKLRKDFIVMQDYND